MPRLSATKTKITRQKRSQRFGEYEALARILRRLCVVLDACLPRLHLWL